ncbi:MAG: preprotein translocase subunit YajC [Candidatus Omnitrophica bacterium]|nr:preprotein translocase subunit YajC [Candidatus Omnitrophota bacterium]
MPNQPTPNPLLQMLPLLLIFLVFYFLLIRPQKQREKERQEMLKSLNKNDEIITSGGIHGTIVNVKEKTVIVRIDDNVKIELEKNCISYVKKPQGSAVS